MPPTDHTEHSTPFFTLQENLDTLMSVCLSVRHLNMVPSLMK